MSTRSDLDRSITEWLVSELPDRAPERLLEASRAAIRTTPQRRAWWPAGRVPNMNSNIVRIAAAVAAVAVAGFIGIQLLGAPDPGDQPVPPPSVSPSAEPSAKIVLPSGLQVAGTGWDATAGGLNGRDGSRYDFACPNEPWPPSYSWQPAWWPVWGTDVYTTYSSVCWAAAHGGYIAEGSGAIVTIELRPGLATYESSFRNGVASHSTDNSLRSFVVVSAIALGQD
jgi:hypothetical protein